MADIGSALYIQFLNARLPFEYLFYLQTFHFKWLSPLFVPQYSCKRNNDHLLKITLLLFIAFFFFFSDDFRT